jgi:hypothetical protein
VTPALSIGAGAHRDADLRLRQGRRVVDAVARHRDEPPLPLQLLHDVDLLFRKYLRLDALDPELLRNRSSGRPAVSGEHDDVDAFVAKCVEGGGRRLLDGIGDA